jgi:3'-5' exoribonuclease
MENKHVDELFNIAKSFGKNIALLSKEVLDEENFGIWTASLDNKHHYGTGGLAQHTLEVVQVALNANKTLKSNVDESELYLACLYHDVGKLWDYRKVETMNDDDEWEGTLHKRTIHHISRSALFWHDAIIRHPQVYDKYHDNVLHAILAHHGCREWGSPVSPFTKCAWLLHLADSMSARMNDCDKFDILNRVV